MGRVDLPDVSTTSSIAFGNGRFVVTLGGRPVDAPAVAWSTDGESWQRAQPASARDFLPHSGTVRFIAGTFYLAGDSVILRSIDGVSWETLPVETGFRSLRGIATNGRGMLIGTANLNDTGLLYTADRVTWRRTPPLPGSEGLRIVPNELAWVAGRYFVSYPLPRPDGRTIPAMAATSDGLTWESVSALDGMTHLASGNNRMVGYGYGDRSVVTTNGQTYTSSPVPPHVVNGGRMEYAGGRFFFLGSLYASLDGLTWAPLATSPLPNIPNMRDIAYGNGRFVAIGYGAPTGSNQLSDIIVRLPASAIPIVSRAPTDQIVAENSPLTLSVTLVNPDTNTTFQWRRNGEPVPGFHGGATFTIPRARLADAGRYTVEIRNSVGIVESDAATVTVVPLAEAGRLINLSVLTTLDAPDAMLTVGFVVGGDNSSGDKTLLVRAAGPSLSSFGIDRPHPDPKLELHNPAGLVAANDQWAGVAALSAMFDAVGAFPFASPGSRDAALVATMPAGDKTARILANNTIGSVIAEVYDATPVSSFTATTPRLLNVSVLKPLAANTSLSAGFVIAGRSSSTVLIRAVGPSLAPFGVAAPLADPQLMLLRTGGAGSLATNNDWSGDPALRAAMSAVSAFDLPASSRDAAILATLEPGNYVAEAKGAPNTAGSVLVEIYEVRP